ncbi:MAG: DUF4214 domain-containing protein, partial [Mycobacterium sp.]|nr:DUF4214 domain-containing protein [Mycobacterium sp.]
YRRQTTTTPASGFGMNLSQSGNVATKVAVTPGQQVAVSAYLATTNASGAQLYVYWYSASGAYLGTSLVTNVALGGSFSSGLSGAIYAAGYTTVIAGAASAVMGAFVVANGSGPLNAAIAEPVLQPVTNAIWDPQFKNVATNWNSLWVSNSSISATLSSYVQGGVNVYQRQTTTTPAAGFGMNLGESSNNMSTLLPVTAGQSVEASAYTASTNASGVSVFVDWFSATGAYLGNSGVGSYVTGGSFSGGLATAIRAGGFATAPSGAAFASLAVYAVANGSGALSVAFSAPMLRLASSGQTALVPYTPDQNGAYFTGLNTEVPSETYTYDSHGNRLSKVDSAGDTEVWTYNGLNQMLTDTLYNVAANGYTAPSGVQTTTYIYGANNNLIYTVSPLGEVVEDLYQGAGGEVTQTVRFAGAYTGALTLTALNTWIATAANQVGAMVTGYSYQLDGQLSSTTHYATSANAQGATSAGVTSYSFDSAGDLLSKGVNGFNPQQTNSYDTLGRLTQSVSQAGVTTNYAYSYNTTGAVTTATTPSTGVVTTSQYNLAGELISTTVTASGLPTLTTSYAYDSLGRLALETDPNGASTYHLYDNTGRKVADVLPDGALTEYVYNANNQVIETIQYATRLTSAQLTTLASATAPVSLASVRPSATGNDRYAWTIYDAAGRVAETIDGAGAVTTYAYDGASNLVATTRYATVLAASALASFTTIPPTSLVLPTASATDATTRSFYDADGRKVGTLDADGDLARFVYDAAGDLIQTTRFATVTSASLRAAGTFAQLLANVGTSPQDQTTNSVYDGAGRLRYAIDPTGRVIEYAYDAAGHLLHEIDYAGSIASTTNYTMDYVQGQISANGLAALAATHTTYDLYDNAGRKVADVLPDGALTEYVYNANNQVIETIQYATRLTSAQLTTLASATAPAGLASVRPAATGNDRYAWTIYDAVGRVTKTIDANGAVTAYVYDADSNLIGATQYATVLSASVVAGFKTAPPTSLNAPTASATDATTRSFYDADGRKVGTLDADGDLTRLVYDAAGDLIQATRFGNVATASLRAAGTFAQLLADVKTSPQDQTTNSVYDGAGRLRYAIDPTGRVTEYAYDAAGHLLHEIDYAGSIASTTSYTMDYVQGQISANALAATRTTRSVYGADGRLYYAIDAMGDVTGYSYDAFGHLVKTARYAAPYAASGDQTLATLNSWASVNASAANDRVTRTVFDTLGRAIYAIDGEGYVTQLQYDADSHVTKQIRYAEVYSVADGVTQSSLAALISANAVVANEAVHRYAYDGDGRVAFDIDATGAVTAFSYDAFGEVVKRHSYNPAYTGSDTSLATLQAWVANTASADSAANRNDQVSRTVYDAAGRVVYTIDADGYLTGYQYDGVGRLLQQTRYASATASAGVYMFDNGDPAYDTIRLFYQATLNRLPDPDPTGGAGWVYSLRNGSTTHDAAVAFTTSAEFLADTNGMSHRQIVDYIYQAALHRPADTAGENQWTAYLDAGNSIADMVVQFLQMPEIQTTYVTPGMVAAMLAANPPASVEITSYSYDAQGRLTQTIVDNGTGHLNLTTSSTYDAFGNKVAVTDPRGDVGYFYYDLLNRLTLQIDPEGYATATTYSIGDQAVSVTRYATRISGATVGSPPSPAPGAQDETTSFTRDKLDRLTATTDAMGFTESYGLDAFGNRITLTSKPPGNDHANSGGVTTYTYDKRGLLLSETLPVTSTKSDGTSVAVTNTYTYDARGNRTKMVEAAGLPEQRTTSYAYDLDNRLVSQTGDAVSILDADLTTLHNNQIPTQTMVYDRRGNVIETDVTLDATHVARTLTYYDDLNRKIAQVDAMGALSTWTYDANNNAIKQFVYDTPITLPATPGGTPPSPANGSSARETDYGYDGNNRLTSTTTAYQNALTGYWNGSTYVLSMSGTPSTPSASATIKTQTTYDAAGNVTSQIDAAGNTTYFYYDRAGRKVAQVNAGGYLTTYTLDSDGNVLTEQRYATAVTGVTASTTLASLLASASNSVAAPPVTTATVAYNSSGNVITPNLGGGAISSIAISTAASHGTATASAGTYTPTLVYTPPANYSGADSFKYTITYANGSTFTGTVNVTVSTSTTATLAVTTSAAGAADRVTTFTYDKNGRRLTETRLNVTSGTVSATGVLSVAQANATITYTYNGLGEVTSKTEATGDQTQYIYDSLGRQTAVLAPTYADYNSATVQTQTQSYYDGLGDLIRSTVGASITVGLYGTTTATDRITTYAYGAGGRLASTTDASGFTKNFYYDRAGRVVAETYSRLKSDGTTVAEAMAFTYDALGRGVAQTTANQLANTAWTFGGGQTVTFGDSNQVRYDAFGQITGKGVNGLWQETYTYDMAGRQFSSTANDGTTKYYVYDANGNNTLEIDSTGTDLSTYTLIGAINLLTNNGANTVGAAAVAGVVVTIKAFDARNENIKTILPFRELNQNATTPTINDAATITTLSQFDAFGDVVQQTDARGGVTNYAYNTEGKLIRTDSPTVNSTDEHGVISAIRPTQFATYDLSGRLIATQDGNGNVNSRALLAGTGYGGADPRETAEFHPDGGVARYGYDVFGDQRTYTNELGNVEQRTYDAMDRVTAVTHPTRAAGTIANPGSALALTDDYAYDGLGQLIQRWNSQLGSSDKQTTDYDSQGRVTKTVDYMGQATLYAYAWSATLATTGLSTFGGWTKTTTNASGLQSTLGQDYFGRTVAHKDFGNQVYTFGFDKAGRLITETSVDSTSAAQQNLTYTYFNTGKIATVYDNTTVYAYFPRSIKSTYKYDVAGHMTGESYVGSFTYFNLSSGLYTYTTSYQNTTVTYDALGRMATYADTGQAAAHNVSIAYEYDANGNIRHMASTYLDLVSNANTTQDFWYKYDGMNRFTTTQGGLVNASGAATTVRAATDQIVRGYTGTNITYDAAGERIMAETTPIIYYRHHAHSGSSSSPEDGYHREDYTYTADGYLATVGIYDAAPIGVTQTAEEICAVNVRDAMGRVTSYTEYGTSGPTGSSTYSSAKTYNADSLVTTETDNTLQSDSSILTTVIANSYNAANLVTDSAVTISKNSVLQSANDTTTTYVWSDTAQQKLITYKTGSSPTNYTTTNTTTLAYDSNGHLTSATIADGRPRTVYYVTNALGEILSRTESSAASSNPVEYYYYLNGMQVGDIGNNGTSQTDYAFSVRWGAAPTGPFANGSAKSYAAFGDYYAPIDPTSLGSQAQAGSTYTVQSGDTLQSIASALWGDSNLWYMIADANGLTGGETLTAGTTLSIPSKVVNIHNNSSTFT